MINDFPDGRPRTTSGDPTLGPARACSRLRGFFTVTFGFRRHNSLISYPRNLLQGSLHLIHGKDVTRLILATRRKFDKLEGQCWCPIDLRVYGWWELTPSAQSGEHDVTDNSMLRMKQVMSERSI